MPGSYTAKQNEYHFPKVWCKVSTTLVPAEFLIDLVNIHKTVIKETTHQTKPRKQKRSNYFSFSIFSYNDLQ